MCEIHRRYICALLQQKVWTHWTSVARRVIPDIEIREAVVNACGLRNISDVQLLTLERRKSVIQEVMRSLDVRPRQLSRVTGMNYETIRNIAKKMP